MLRKRRTSGRGTTNGDPGGRTRERGGDKREAAGDGNARYAVGKIGEAGLVMRMGMELTLNTSVRRRLCARAATGRWVKKADSATERESAHATWRLLSWKPLCFAVSLLSPSHSQLSLAYVASAKCLGKRVNCHGH